jgi:ABC-type branched-subunit amino acid transport system substrate-binding protein
MSARLPRVRHNLRAFDPRPIAARVIAFAALAFLAACDLPVPSASGNSGQTINPSAPIQVALLVPGGTGQTEFDIIASGLENAARMAIADLNGAQIDLRVYNTGRDPAQAAQVAAVAVAEGAQIILGPLDAESANAVGLTVAASNVNVLSYSNNPAVAGGNVFVLGKTFGNISDRLVSYAASQGVNRFMIVHQDDLAGAVGRDAIATSIRSSGGTIAGVESYTFSQQGIFSRAPAIAAAANRNAAQAVFVTDTIQGGLSILATSLDDQGLSSTNTPFIGLTQWDVLSSQPAALPALQNGLFAKGNAGREAAFDNRYQATYGTAPHPLASIAYDGIAAIGALAATGDRIALTTASLTRASGFAGATGIFRLRRDGSNQRALAVARIVDNQIVIVDPAPQSFGRGGS